MQNKSIFACAFLFSLYVFLPTYVNAEDLQEVEVIEEDISTEMDAVSADAIASYDAENSVFQQIVDLEQEKVLMELEKERAQLDLELDKLAAEKIKLHMEIEELSGRAEQQKQEIANAQAELEVEAERLEKEKQALKEKSEELSEQERSVAKKTSSVEEKETKPSVVFDEEYRLVNVIGIGSQLQAKIENLETGQTKVVSVGKNVDGYVVQSISLDDGIVFTNGSDTQTLNIIKSK